MSKPILRKDQNRRTLSASDGFDHGRNSSVGTTTVQLTTVDMPAMKSVLVKAERGNAGIVYVGNPDVTTDTNDATDGFDLASNESVEVEVDNANKIYVRASQASQAVRFMVS